jgi:CheY-like chemotaxis protein
MPVQGGTGIGLSLCRELATLLGGEVWAESEFGQGSTFFYRFPKVLATGAALDSLPAEEVVAATEKALAAIASFESRQEDGRSAVVGPEDRGSQLLIVEDNPQLREYMHLLLGGDYRVSLAENGLQAWQLLEEGLFPDLIISDLMMPVMDGFQLLERIKGSDRLRHLPVIMLTARADVQVRLQALRIGVDDYLTKPFVEEELRVRIANLLRNHRERLRAAEQDLSGLKDGEGSAEGQAPLQVISMADAEWLERAEQYFLKHIAEPEFKMEQAAEALHMSERHFRRQLKKLTGLSPNLYLRELRLQAAQDYLLQGRYKTIKETSFAVGFINVNYFSNLFFERFGKMPSAYLSQ